MARSTVYAAVTIFAVAVFAVAKFANAHDGIGGEHVMLIGLPLVTALVEMLMIGEEDVR